MATTNKHLEDLAEYVNKITNSPSQGEDSHKIYGLSLVRIVNDSGGIRTIIYGKSKNDLFDKINCFINGINYSNMNHTEHRLHEESEQMRNDDVIFTEQYTEHRLYAEFEKMRNDDVIFAEQYSDTESDFMDWVMGFELDSDWE